jgi:hypothetical protein
MTYSEISSKLAFFSVLKVFFTFVVEVAIANFAFLEENPIFSLKVYWGRMVTFGGEK